MAVTSGSRNGEDRQARLVKALLFQPDNAACQACLDQLDEYVAAQLAGEDYVARFPQVALHLDACLDCAGAYARLYELELATAEDRLPQPERWPSPDLSFLHSGAGLMERLREAIRRVGDRLTLQLSADLLPLLHPAPAFTPVRAPADAERYAEVLMALEPDQALRPDLPITLTVYRDSHHPEECLVEVVVEPPGRSWPDLGGLSVALNTSKERREATTDPWGLASFEGVPVMELGNLTVEVEFS